MARLAAGQGRRLESLLAVPARERDALRNSPRHTPGRGTFAAVSCETWSVEYFRTIRADTATTCMRAPMVDTGRRRQGRALPRWKGSLRERTSQRV